MAKLRLIVKSRSKAEQNTRELENAAAHLQQTALYLQKIESFLEETSYVDADNSSSGPHEGPKSMPPAPGVVTAKETVRDLTAEDVEAALILANMRTERTYTSAELGAATALTMMQMGSSTANWGVQREEVFKVQENTSPGSSATGRALRPRPARVAKPVSWLTRSLGCA